MIGYVTLGTNDIERAARFYDPLAAEMGVGRMMDFGTFIAWGKPEGAPGIAATKPFDGKEATVGNGTMVAIEAKLQSGQPKTSFWAAKDKVASGAAAGDRSFSRVETIQDVSSHSSQQRIHRGVGIFAVSMEVEGNHNVMPMPGRGYEANLSFTLVSLRTWGSTDCVAPIVHAPSKWY